MITTGTTSGGRAGRVATAVLAVLLAVTGAVLTAPAATAADAAPTRAAVFTRGADPGARVVTLTMDADWYTPGDVTRVLQILRDDGITAGFGLTGRYVERYPEQVRAIAAAGHKLINHSYDHPAFTGLTTAQRADQLDRAEAAFRRLGLSTDGWFRAPYRDGYLDDGSGPTWRLAGTGSATTGRSTRPATAGRAPR